MRVSLVLNENVRLVHIIKMVRCNFGNTTSNKPTRSSFGLLTKKRDDLLIVV